MKKILFVLIALVVCVGLIGSAFAYFSDTESSTGNTFTAGTLDLAMSNGTGWENEFSGTLATVADMAPGEQVGPFDVYFKNDGTMDGVVDVNMSYVNFDDPDAYGEFVTPAVSGTAYAKKLVVTEAYLDTDPENKAPYWAAQCITAHGGDASLAEAAGEIVAAPGASPVAYLPTAYGLSTITLEFWIGGSEVVWAPGESHSESFYLMLAADADSDYAFDGVSLTLSATIDQYIPAP